VSPPVERETLGRRLGRVNRYSLLAAMGLLAIGCVVASFALGLVNIIDSSRVQGRILSENLSAAVMFQDRAGAMDVLRSVRFASGIESATLTGNDGVVFSAWQRDVVAQHDSANPERSWFFHATHVEVSQPVLTAAGSRVVARLYLTIDLASLYGRTGVLAFIALLT
jgi:hypothetical protein